MTGNCLSCNSARVLVTGPRAGSVWCFVKRNPVNPDCVCQSFVGYENSVRNRMESNPSQRVLVKSAVESQFETNFGQARPTFASRLYPETGLNSSMEPTMFPDGFSGKEANISPLGANAERTAQTIEDLPEGRSPRHPRGALGVWGAAPRFAGHRDAPSMIRQDQPEGPSQTGSLSGAVQGLREATRSVAMAGGLGACPQGFQAVGA